MLLNECGMESTAFATSMWLPLFYTLHSAIHFIWCTVVNKVLSLCLYNHRSIYFPWKTSWEMKKVKEVSVDWCRSGWTPRRLTTHPLLCAMKSSWIKSPSGKIGWGRKNRSSSSWSSHFTFPMTNSASTPSIIEGSRKRVCIASEQQCHGLFLHFLLLHNATVAHWNLKDMFWWWIHGGLQPRIIQIWMIGLYCLVEGTHAIMAQNVSTPVAFNPPITNRWN
jgi:hypothetical protein